MITNEIKIIGISSLALDTLERISIGTIKNTDFIVCDMDADKLARSSIQNKILLGTGKIKSLSFEKQIELGMDSVINSELDVAIKTAINSFDQLDSLFVRDFKMAILLAPLGNTTGAGATPVIAQIAKNRGLFVVAIVYTPFDFEGEIANKIANKGLKKLREDCDFVLVIKYSKIGKLYGNLSFKSSFGKADDIVIRLAKIVSSMGSINPHRMDIILFFKKNQVNKPFFIGIGEGNGTNRAKDVIELALKNTLSERDTFEGVGNVLLQVNYGSAKITTNEMVEIERVILNALKNECSITISESEDNSLGEELSVMLIAY
jgi:cell division protein FtsZ